MKDIIAAAISGMGFVAFVIGMATYLSPASVVARTLNSSPSDQDLWLALGGLFAVIVGLGSLAMAHRNQIKA